MQVLIKGADVLLFEPTVHTEKADIAIQDGAILAVGNIPANFAPARTIDGHNKLATPGLINSHTHAYMTLFRNFADDLSFDDWLFGRILPHEDMLTPEDAYWGNLLACMEMLQGGTTCFLDMPMFPLVGFRAAREAGMRMVSSRGVVGGAPGEDGVKRRLAEMKQDYEEAKHTDMLHVMMASHAIYTCGKPLLSHVTEVARGLGLRQHIHVSESAGEVERCFEAHGCSPVRLLADLGYFDVPTVAAHCVHMREGDIELLARHGVSVATNPVSNMKLANGFAPVPDMLKAGVNVCIGTDGAASNNNLNMMKELAVLSLVHKGLLMDPQAMPAAETLLCATKRGAAALGLSHLVGELKPGLRADIALFSLDDPAFYPKNDLMTSLVYSASGCRAHTVLIDGNIVLENGALPNIDAERVYAEVEAIRKRISA